MEIALFMAFVLYFGILIGIGIISSITRKTSDEFMLANNKVNYWVTAIAAHASDMSIWLFMGFPAAIYSSGLGGIWIAIGLLFGMFISWQYIAYALRTETERFSVTTLSDFFEKKFNDGSGLINIISNGISIFYFTIYIAAGVTGMGHVFHSVFQINYHLGMALGLLGSLLYIIMGGFIAIAWNHFFQGMFLLIMLMIVPIYSLLYTVSFADIISNAARAHIPLTLIPSNILTLVNGFAWGFGYIGMPHVIINYMAIDNSKDIPKAKYLGMCWLITTLTAAALVGLIAIGYFHSPLENNELVFVQIVKDLFSPFIAGLILCAILAATMSTIDTQILVISNAITYDFYKKLFFPKSTDASLVWVSKISIILISFISYLICIPYNTTVMQLVSYAWSGLASAFSPLILYGLYCKKTNKTAATMGLIVGAITSGIWPLFNSTLLPLIAGSCAHFFTLFFIHMYLKRDK